MKAGISIFLWKVSVALYLIANGILGVKEGGDFAYIFKIMFKGDVSVITAIASVIAIIAGVFILLEMLNVQFSLLDTLILIIAIIWVVYVIIEIIVWLKEGFDLKALQTLAVHLMVLSSLMIASRKFG
jgi:hypothetical protein